jgi:trimeric autotransporter adhesin
MRSLRSFALCVLASGLLCVTAATAQNAAPATRIVNPIDESQLVTLKGSVHPLATAKNDRGTAADSTPLERIHLRLKRSQSQEATLQQLIGQLHTPGNASYHKWLTPDQFGKQFGPSDQDIATVTTWLTGHGFNVTKVLPGKQAIEFSGNVGQLRNAFHTQIHQYAVNGESHFANANDPQIPAAIAPVVGGFVSLNNFHAKSEIKSMGTAQYDRTTDRATADWTWGTSAGVNFVLAPGDFAVEYDLNPLYTASTPVKGAGQTIAIINDSNVNIDLVNQFRSLFGLSVNPPQIIIDGNDPGVNGDSVEAYLDVEWAGAVAPDATVDLVIGADTATESGLYLAAEHAVYGNIAPVMSMSFGFCELGVGINNSFWNDLWEQAAAQGITAMVSSGDAGSAGCDSDDTQSYAVNGQAVNGFGSTPFNVSVGGTDFYYSFWNSSGTTLSSFDPYWNTNPTQTPGVSLKGYLEEQPWNDSQFGLNLGNIYTESGGQETSIAAGSGGPSTCATGTGSIGNGEWAACTAGYAKPSWQVGTGVPNDGVRDLPDVSLFAANGLNYSFYPICAVDGDCQPATGNNVIQISGVGGTSASSPAFAGMMALVNQKYGPQGQANYILYPLAKQFPAVYHDVTVGTNTVPCDLSDGTANCITAPNGLGYTLDIEEGEIGSGTTAWYNAGTGYDMSSGLGTIDANQMVTNWPNVKFDATSTTLAITPPGGVSLSSIPHGTALTVSGTVTGTGKPTGDVSLLTDSTEAAMQGQTFFTLSNGAYSNNSVNYLPGGTYNVWTQYGGDGTNALSTSTPVAITVMPEASNVSFNANESGATIASGTTGISYGTAITLDAQAGPSSCATSCPASYSVPTGSIVFSDGSTALNTAIINTAGDAEYTPPNSFNVGSHTVSAKYSGDQSYNAKTSSSVTFSVVQAVPVVVVTGSYGGNSYTKGQTSTLTIAVESLANGAAPLGSITLSGVPSGTPTTATLSAGVDPSYGTTVGLATVTIPASAPTGTYNIGASYTPNSASSTNYAAATTSGTYPVQITGASGIATTTTGTASSAGTSPNAGVTVTGTVKAASGSAPTGTVYFLFAIIYQGTFQYVYQSTATLVPGSGTTSTYSFTTNSQSLVQGANQLTIQYAGAGSDDPSTAVISINNPLSDFSLTANTTIIPVTAGDKGTTTINLAAVNGFSGAVGLTCSAGTGTTCSLSSSSVSLSAGSPSGATTLTVNAPSGTKAGNYNVLITGKDATGQYVHTLGLRAQVSATGPVFALTNSGGVTVAGGATTGNTSTITVTPSNGFTGGVNLTCAVTSTPTSPTSPATCSVTPSVTISGTTAATGTLTVGTTSTTTAGAYVVTVTGKDAATGKISESTAVNVTVNAPPSFALTNSGAISFQAGATTGDTATVTITPAGGFTGNVALTCAVTPVAATSPATCSAVTPVDISGTTAGTSKVTVATTATTTPGTYTATVTGTNGSITSSTGIGVTVTAPPVPAITLTNSGAIAFVAGATSGNTATITVTPSNAFTGVVDLTCAVTSTPTAPTSPATCKVTNSVDITNTTALTGTLTVDTTATTTPGAYVVTVTGKDEATGKVISSTPVSVTVNAIPVPGIALTNSGAISFIAGQATGNTATITVTPSNGFTGLVNLTCAVTPTAANSPATCAVPAVTIASGAKTSTMTVTTTASTTPGSYTATISGKDAATGKVTGSTTVGVTVLAVPDFTLANNGPITFGVGATSGNTATITVAPVNAFNSVVNMSCAVTTTPTAPTSPATCSLASSTVAGGSGTDVLTIATTSTTTTGNYAVTVTGGSGTLTHTTVVNVTVNGSYTVTASSPAAIAPGASATSTVTVASTNGYAGGVTITCTLTSSATSDPPSCSNGSQTVTLSSTTTSGTATVTVGTTGSSSSELVMPKLGPGKGWMGAGSGAILALVLFFGIPARKRSWRTMLGALVLMVIMGAMAGCGGGGGGGNKGTPAGTYTFTVTAAGNPAQGSGDTTTFTVTVN